MFTIMNFNGLIVSNQVYIALMPATKVNTKVNSGLCFDLCAGNHIGIKFDLPMISFRDLHKNVD
ncbi:MAG TPA: hypothetical protein PK068_11765, partial [Nitrosomonas sp.]|nr:hypothetical protein [Nitrosomonas sp.]